MEENIILPKEDEFTFDLLTGIIKFLATFPELLFQLCSRIISSLLSGKANFISESSDFTYGITYFL